MKLSILDQVRVSSTVGSAAALRNSMELARLGDELGYHRYWVAEHHGSSGTACSCPEVLLARIGAATSEIRIGAGGILLPHYSAFKVAETFRTLEALYPDRVDLGIGRAAGGESREVEALKRHRIDQPFASDFREQLVELLQFLDGHFPEGHPFCGITVSPHLRTVIPVWLLGSSPASARTAANLGLPYAFAQFISPPLMRQSMETYRSQFQEQNAGRRSNVILALSAVCVENEGHLQDLIKAARQGRSATLPAARNAPAATTNQEPWERCRFVGTPETVRSGILSAAIAAEADEVMILAPFGEHDLCMQSYRLIAEAFCLQKKPNHRATEPKRDLRAANMTQVNIDFEMLTNRDVAGS